MPAKKPTKRTLAASRVATGEPGGKARMESMSERDRLYFASSGGKVGGKARAEKLSPERRREIARAAARARWSKD